MRHGRPQNQGDLRAISRLGISTPYLVAAAAGFIYFKFIKKNDVLANSSAFLFAAIALSGLANDLIKVLVGRSRPGLLLSQGIYGFKPFSHQYYYASFPSGHANTIAALCYGLKTSYRTLQVYPAECGFGCNGEPCYSGRSFPKRCGVRSLPWNSRYRTLTAVVVARRSSRDRPAKIAVGIAVIIGAEDVLIRPANSTYLSEHLPNAELIVIPGAGHALRVECRDFLNRTAHDFYQREIGP